MLDICIHKYPLYHHCAANILAKQFPVVKYQQTNVSIFVHHKIDAVKDMFS